MPDWILALLPVAAGAAITVAVTQVNSWFTRRHAKADAKDARALTHIDEQQSASAAAARQTLEDLAPLVKAVHEQFPNERDGFSYSFDPRDVRKVRDSALHIPNETIRRSVEKSLDLLGGWQVLQAYGPAEDDLPMTQQRRAVLDARAVLGACVRNQPADPAVVERIRQKHDDLGKAWAADEAAMKTAWLP
jgi:hypothetical protein